MVTRDYGGVTRDNFKLRGEEPTNNINESQTTLRLAKNTYMIFEYFPVLPGD